MPTADELMQCRQPSRRLVQVADKEVSRHLRARKQTLPSSHSTRHHNIGIHPFWLWRPECAVVGVTVLRLWDDFGSADCDPYDHNGVFE